MTPVKKIAVTGIMMLGAALVTAMKVLPHSTLICCRSLAASIARLVLYLQTQQAAIQEIPVDFDGQRIRRNWSMGPSADLAQQKA